MRKIKWGVLGTAKIAKDQTIPGMQQADNCELYAIAGRSAEKVESFKNEFGFEKAYTDYDALLADEAVEAVYIPLPNNVHCEWVKKALKAKKYVLCEKPLAVSTEEIKEMHACAKENGVVVMEAFAYLHSPYQKAVRDIVQSGELGQILYMDSKFITCTYNDSNIRLQKEQGAGAIFDLGTYNTSQILFMLGKAPDKIQAIAHNSENDVDVFANAIMTYEDGCIANLTCGMVLAKEKYERIDHFAIYGTEGNIESHAEFNQEGDLAYTITKNGVSETKTVSCRQNYCLEVEQLGRVITDGEEPGVSYEFTLQNMALLERVIAAIK